MYPCEKCQVQPVLEHIQVKRYFLDDDYRYVCPKCGRATRWCTGSWWPASIEWNCQTSIV